MQILSRCKGERIEIDGCAQIRVARIEEGKVKLDVKSPFGVVVENGGSTTPSTGVKVAQAVVEIKLLEIATYGKSEELRASFSIRSSTPGEYKARRAEVVLQQTPPHLRFPWNRFSVTKKIRCELSGSFSISVGVG